MAGSDFVQTTGTLSLPPGTPSTAVTVPIVGDLLVEPSESFSITLSNPINVLVADGAATGTIIDTDVSEIAVSDVAPVEGNSGSPPTQLVVSLSTPHYLPVTMHYQTSEGSAASGADFTSVGGTLTFPPGSTSAPVSVPIVGDLLDEFDETFVLQLSQPAPASAVLQDGTALATIVDDDPIPTISIGNAAVTEGDCGHTPITFTVSLSQPSGKNVQFLLTTEGQTATADVDFLGETLSFGMSPGVGSFGYAASVKGDRLDESTETFNARLSNIINAAPGVLVGAGTIVDNDVGAALGGTELGQGSDQWRIAPASGIEWLSIGQRPYASYEVVVEGASGTLNSAGSGPEVSRMSCSQTQLLQSDLAVGVGFARSLRWRTAGSLSANDELIRVRGSCAPSCATSMYRVRAYETTYALPRFNNTGTQYTVVLIQNSSAAAVTGELSFWTQAGSLLGSYGVNLAPNQLLTLDTRTVGGAVGQSGSMTLANDGRYGELVGKAVGIDTNGGLTFDTPRVPRVK